MAGTERTRIRPPLHDGPLGGSAKSARDARAAPGSTAARAAPRVGAARSATRRRGTSEENPRVRVRRREAPVPRPVRPVRPAIRDAPPEAAVVGVVRVAPSRIEREVRGCREPSGHGRGIAIPFRMTADGITNMVRLHRPGGGGDIIVIPRPRSVDEHARLRIRPHGTGCRPGRPDTDQTQSASATWNSCSPSSAWKVGPRSPRPRRNFRNGIGRTGLHLHSGAGAPWRGCAMISPIVAKPAQACIGQTAASGAAGACGSSPSRPSLPFTGRTDLPAGRTMRPARRTGVR